MGFILTKWALFSLFTKILKKKKKHKKLWLLEITGIFGGGPSVQVEAEPNYTQKLRVTPLRTKLTSSNS